MATVSLSCYEALFASIFTSTMQHLVYVNGRFLSQNFTGVQRFSREITRALLAEGVALRILAPRNACLDGLEAVAEVVGRQTGHVWEQIELPRYLYGIGAPLLLNFGNLAPLVYRNKVVTLHDVAYLLLPRSYPLVFRQVYRRLMPAIVRRARAVVTVSEFSKTEIARTYPVDHDKITVVYNAADDRFRESNATRRADTFLALAADSDQKNHQCILEAFARLAQTRTAHLRIMGHAPRFADHPLLNVPGASTVTQLGRVTDAQLVDEYQCTSAFIFPPLYAGFGIPPIEAQSCGCPVIASTADALKEVLADSALYFDPASPAQLCEVMTRFLDVPELAGDLRERGRRNARRFDWAESARRIRALLKDLDS